MSAAPAQTQGQQPAFGEEAFNSVANFIQVCFMLTDFSPASN
jgi:hypothetical protein